MKIYNPSEQKITLSGIDYYADENGIIDVPNNKINSSVWTQGFVSASGRLSELAKIQVSEPKAKPIKAVLPAEKLPEPIIKEAIPKPIANKAN